MAQATCTDGPSLLTKSPEVITRGCFVSESSQASRESAHRRQTLDQECPEAKEALHDEARQYTFNLRNAGTGGVFSQRTDEVGGDEGESSLWLCRPSACRDVVEVGAAYRKKHVYEPPRHCHGAPQMPGIARAVIVDFQLPTAELLVQPPADRTIAHLHVREPFRDYGDERGVDSDTSTCTQVIACTIDAEDGPTDDADNEP